MGCGSSKDTTGDSPKKKSGGGAGGNKRKSNAKPEQVDVDVQRSERDLNGEKSRSPSPDKSSPSPTRGEDSDHHHSNSPRNTDSVTQRSEFESKPTQNGHVNGRARKSRYDDQASDQTSVQEANDKGYKRRIREKLKASTSGHDIEELEKTMGLFERSRLDDCGDLTRAKERHRYLKLRRDLRDAIRRQHVGVLDRTIADAKGSPYAYQLHSQLEAAEKLRNHLKELNTYNHDILQMEQTTISELRSYQRPPTCVHDVMAATYMLLGQDEDKLTDWADIQCHMGRLGKDSLMRQVETFDTNDVDDQTAGRVQEILGYHDLDQVRAASNGAARFHVWANQMVEKIGKDKQQEEDKRREEDEKTSRASSKAARKKKG